MGAFRGYLKTYLTENLPTTQQRGRSRVARAGHERSTPLTQPRPSAPDPAQARRLGACVTAGARDPCSRGGNVST